MGRKKMNLRKKCIATSLMLLGCLLLPLGVWAGEVVGTVAQLSGVLLVKRADGSLHVLSRHSKVEQGDLLTSEKDSFAQIRFVDNSEVTLKPNTQFKIENFRYREDKQEDDNAFFSLLRGGLRAISGKLGKRSNERFGLSTPTATVGIRGTTFIAEYVEDTGSAQAMRAHSALQWAALDMNDGLVLSDAGAPSMYPAGAFQLAQAAPSGGGGLSPGLYVQVIDGAINLKNSGGSQSFVAGQFGYTASASAPPVVVPSNPGIQFNPPPAFNASSGAANGGNQPKAVNCEVR